MNKKIITTALLISGFAYSNNFLVIVNKEHNEYEHDKGTTRIEISEWINYSPERCSLDLLESDFYEGVDFTQNKDCEQDQERTITTIRTYSNGKEIVENETKEYQTLESNETFNLVGTHLEDSCKLILENDYSIGSGYYKISTTDNPTVYCEMDRQGGGWMLVEKYNWYENSNNIPPNLIKTTNRTINTNKMLDGWWIPDYTGPNEGNVRWIEINAQPKASWSQSMIEFEGIGHRSLDEFYNIHNNGISDRDTVNGQYLDGFSITSGNQGSRNHLYSIAVGYAPMDDTGRLSTTLYWIGNNYAYKDMADSYSSEYPANVVYSRNEGNEIISEIQPLSNNKVSLRLMADQAATDETIGIRKYIVWVK